MHQDLGLTDVARTGGGCCGDARGDVANGSGQRWAVAGMTCAHCVASVTEELESLDGVDSVAVELRPGGVSTVSVRASRPLADGEVRAAVEEAGYALTNA